MVKGNSMKALREMKGGPLPGMISERDLTRILGMTRTQISYLRAAKGLPFIKLTHRKRVYLEKDLIKWFRKCRVENPVASTRRRRFLLE